MKDEREENQEEDKDIKELDVELTPKDVDDIRKQALRGISKASLARKYRVDSGHIDFILNRKIK